MDRQRLDFQLSQFRKALAALEAAIATDEGDKKSRDSLLLSFVFTFEMAWKSVKFALAMRDLEVDDYAAAALKAGFQASLISDTTAWDLLRKHRNNVSHAYDEEKAIVIAAFVRGHAIQHFRELIARLERDE